MSEITRWTQEHHDIANEAMSEGGCRGALGQIFANAYFVEYPECQRIASRAMAELRQGQPALKE